MKKNRTMRAAVLMLALTLITSCFVGSTFAKYTTGVSANDTARVAKFGVTLTTDTAIFDKTYAGEDSVTVKGDQNLIAPGTTGVAFEFTIAGAPEVDVNVLITLDVDSALSMVTLPKGDDYADWTTLTPAGTPAGTFDVATAYNPVKWTLEKNGAPVLTDVNLATVENYFHSISKDYDVEAAAGSGNFADVIGTYTLTWTWDFEYDNNLDPEYAAKLALINKMDTYIANVMASVQTDANVVLNETFKFNITVTQVD